MLALLIIFGFFSRFPIVKAEVKASEGEKWAIIVGVSSYLHVDNLMYADKDAIDLRNKIAPVFGADHVRLLINGNATKSNINSTIFNWLDPLEDANDTVLFFFSGHGSNGNDVSPFDENDNLDEYICPYDALSNSFTNDIRDDELKTWLNTLDSGKIVVILDTCYSGGFINDLAKSGREILAACAENELSSETGSLGHGVFSYFLLQALGTMASEADLNGNNLLSVEELFNFANANTLEYTSLDNDQHPVFYDGYTGELSLVPLSMVYYLVTFTQSGLPLGMNWSATLNGTTLISNGSSITFNIASGTYNYSINLPSGYTSSSLLAGSIIVNTDRTVSFDVVTSLTNSIDIIILLVVIIAIIAIIVIVSAILIVRKRRSQSTLPPPPPPPPPYWGQPSIQRVNCMFCNQENNIYANYCIACGRQLRDPLTQQPIIILPTQQVCPFCGLQNSPDQNFCTFCGKKLK